MPVATGDIHSKGVTKKDAGLLHTEAFEKLGKIYKNKRPESDLDLIMDVSNVLSEYCPPNDSSYSPHRITMEVFHSLQHGLPEIKYPDDFDENVKGAIDKTISTVNELNELNVDEIVQQLEDIQADLGGIDYDSEAYHTMSMVSVSVAIESVKLWHAAVFDSSHDLHEAVTGGHRKLQTADEVAGLTEIVLTDFASALNGGIVGVSQNASLFFMPADLAQKTVLAAIAGSASAALSILQESNWN